MGKKGQAIAPFVPRELIVAPFFAAVKQSAPRELVIDGKRWVIGTDHPTKRRPSPALDMRHGRACFALLSFRDRLTNERDISFSMNELCHRYARSQGGRFARDLLNILYDLQDTFVARERDDGDIEIFQILGDIKIHGKPVRRKDAQIALSLQREMWLDRVSLSPEFFGLMQRWEELARIRLDVLNQIRSPKAQAIYTYIPSRAVHHTKSSPFSIKLATVLEQIGAPVPHQKSVRKKVFTQHKENSIINQLNGLETVDGVLRVEMVETRDGSDYKLISWVEKTEQKMPSDSSKKMSEAWAKSGRTQKAYEERLKNAKPLTGHHEDLLERAGVELKSNERFFGMAYALLGLKFEQILSEAKGDALQGDPGDNPTKRLIWRIMNALEQG